MSARNSWKYFLSGFVFLICVGLFVMPQSVSANFRQFSDTLSSSAPNEFSNHTIQFTSTKTIEPGATIRFRVEPGTFTIPAVKFSTSTGSTSPPTPNTFGNNNVELLVDTGAGFVRRNTGTTTSSSIDGVGIVSGTAGNVSVTLNSTSGIPTNARVRFLIGNHTSRSIATDTTLKNPTTTMTYPVFLSKTGTNATEVRPLVAIIDPVTIGPVDTTEEIPPFLFNGAPTGTLPGTSINVEVSLNTDEFADCRYSTTASTTFNSMTNIFTQTGLIFHSFLVAVTPDTAYTFYIRCEDDEGNQNIEDYPIIFNVLPTPTGNPGDVGDEPGSGDGTGTGSGNSGSGSGSGGGDTSNTSSGGGGSSGGGSGGGNGDDTDSSAGGGFELTDAAYPSGDGQVIINGSAFPNSTIVILVDGAAARTVRSNSQGKFAVTLDAIARGVYNFGIYGVDSNDVRSSTFTTTFTVTGSRSSSLSNINLAPSILVEPDPVDPGDTVTFSGYTLPNAAVTIENQSEKTSASKKTFETTSDSSGEWSIDVDTTGFVAGTYKVRAKAQTSTVSTNFSNYTLYGVGEAVRAGINADLNRDGKVNLIDFSILLFWWGSDGGDSNPPADINADRNVSLTDFSILLFNWTG